MLSSQLIKLDTNPITLQKNKGKFSVVKNKTDY